ncbi:MAG: RluA family pseudouridine synthase [Clostridiales bacterium]|nr:RluA family pseudouridine synthase [Clostridiales bacterium]
MKYFSKAPKGFVYKMIRKKRIKLNGGRADGNEILNEGDKIQMYLSDETMAGFMEKKTVVHSERKFDIVYEDENVLAVNKSAGVLSHSESAYDKDTLIDQILSYLNEKGEYNPEQENSFTPALANRLDRNTSGIVLAGKTADALRQINEAVKTRKIKKLYKAIVCGTIEKGGRLEDLYSKDRERNKAALGEGDKKIITEYKPLKTKDGYTVVEVKLITGKSHQIRVHMASMGCPIIGDIKYGNAEENAYFRKKAGVKRQLLHAYRLEFGGFCGGLEHLNGKVITADEPEDFKRAEKIIFG